MRSLFFTTIMLCGIMTQAQKIERDKIDDFTKDRTVITSSHWIGKGVESALVAIGAAIFKADSGIVKWVAKLYISAPSYTAINSEHKVIFLFDNDETKEANHIGKSDFGKTVEAMVFIDADLLELMQTRSIKKIRIHTSQFYMDCEANEKQKDLFKKMIPLIQERLGR